MNLNRLAILFIELDPKNLKGLEEFKNGIRTELSGSRGRQKRILNDILVAAEGLPGLDLETCQKGLVRIGELLEQVMESSQPSASKTGNKNAEKKSINNSKPGSFTLPSELDAELLSEFVAENLEYVAQAESALMDWEKDPTDKELLNTIFRAFHTIKGTASFINLDHIKEMAHQVESMLARVRDGQAVYSAGDADLALRSLDVLKNILIRLKSATPNLPVGLPVQYEEVMETLRSWGAVQKTTSAADPANNQVPVTGFKEWLSQKNEKISGECNNAIGKASDEQSDASVRIRIDRLDKLLDMVGELVIAQSMVSQDDFVLNGGHYGLSKKISHAGKIVRELQDLSMYLRMVPFKATFQKLNRLARDLAMKSGKMVNFISEGAETEIDRNMVDLITDPLIHMIRNSIDHGIEMPEERRRLGKSGDGCIWLEAGHSEGNILIKIKDDGRGLNRSQIVKKALERGLIESGQHLSDQEVWQLIFQPGFSTADQVTEVSGRGVGLDVVGKAVEALRGRVEIESAEGHGCTFTIRMPLTMTITDGMVVRVGEEKYILPTANIQIAIRPTVADIHTVEGKGEMISLRGQMLPVFRLHRLFNVSGAKTELTDGLLVVVGEGLQKCALFVDDLLAQNQVVTKSLGNNMGKVPGIAGGAIMGDGRVGLILDVKYLITAAMAVALV